MHRNSLYVLFLLNYCGIGIIHGCPRRHYCFASLMAQLPTKDPGAAKVPGMSLTAWFGRCCCFAGRPEEVAWEVRGKSALVMRQQREIVLQNCHLWD